MKSKSRGVRYATVFLLSVICLPLHGQKQDDETPSLLEHLAGNWVLEGMLGGRHVTHDITAEWILNHEYLRLHEVSRDKNKGGGPAYEALILISWDSKAKEYRCLWLDNTEGGGLSVPAARAKPEGQSMTFAFAPPYQSLHTTFEYDKQSDGWRLTIDDIKDGKPYRFGDDTLRRASPVDR